MAGESGGEPIRLGVISDTHGLLRPEVPEALAGVDRILHAGDVGSREILDALSRIAPVTAVRGNTDHGRWADSLPPVEVVSLGAATIYLLHDLGALDLNPAAAGFQAVIFGHSHKPAVRENGGVLYLNPGSAGPRRFDYPVTAARVEVVGARLAPRIVHLLER
ncbi:MAG: metallophosphoesterase family protein [Desulfococcaceae bacterium]